MAAEMDLDAIARINTMLVERKRRPEIALTREELLYSWQQGNDRALAAPTYADNTKLVMVDCEDRWIAFCTMMKLDWKVTLATFTLANKGLIEAFVRYLLRRAGSRILTLSVLCVYIR